MMFLGVHFLRPLWLLMLLFWFTLVFVMRRQRPKLQGWIDVCDPHLLAHLLQSKAQHKRKSAMYPLLASLLLMIISLSGPSWHKLPVPTYKQVQARVLLLDMSDNMMDTDLTPNRAARAKFKLHDLLARKEIGQFALIAYTAEPFVVSPLTDDGATISSLLEVLNHDLMPVSGQKLESALDEASRLIKEAGYQHAQILVLTADTPSGSAIDRAKQLADTGVYSSIMPIRADKDLNPLFARFAQAGQGQLLPYRSDSSDLDQWINAPSKRQFLQSNDDEIPLWRDEGGWFLIPALFFLLPLFQRGRVQRVAI